MTTIEQRVTEIVTGQLSVKADRVKPEARLMEDLGADSLDVVELAMALEEAFGLNIPDEQAEQLETVQDLIRFLEESRSQPEPA